MKKEYLLLIIIIFLFFILRIYNLHKQSVTFDEFIFISNTNIFNLPTYLNLFLAQHPDYGLSPLTPIIIYTFAYIFNYSIPAIRMIPIIFGFASILIVYAMGKKLFNEKIGLIASLLLCFSPMNIWIQQEIKCYSFCLFFSLLSFYSLMNHIFEEKKLKWLLIGAVSNLILPWLHPTYIFVPASQIIIILSYSKTLKTFFVRAFPPFISCILWTAWFFSQKSFLYIPNEPYKESLSVYRIFESLFCNDSVGLSADLLPVWKTNDLSIIENSVWKLILPYGYIFDYLLAFLIFILTIFFIINSLLFSIITRKREDKSLFILLILIIPVAPFIFLQFLRGDPFLTVQYFMYTLSALYICISAQIVKIKNKYTKNILISMLITCFIFQAISLICFKNRTDYKSAFEYLEKEMPPHGILLGQRFSSVYDVGKIYMKRDDIEYIPILSLNAFIDKSYNLLFSEENRHPSLFLLMEPSSIKVFGIEKPEEFLTPYFEKNNMKVHWTYFPGQFNLYIGKVTRNSNNLPRNMNDYIPLANGAIHDNLLQEFGFTFTDITERNHTLNVLRNNFYIYPHFPVFYSLILSNLIWENELEIANKICDKLIQKYPNFGTLYLIKGILLSKEGNKIDAQKYMDMSFHITPPLKHFYANIMRDLTSANESVHSNICQYISEMDKSGFILLDKALLSFCNK